VVILLVLIYEADIEIKRHISSPETGIFGIYGYLKQKEQQLAAPFCRSGLFCCQRLEHGTNMADHLQEEDIRLGDYPL